MAAEFGLKIVQTVPLRLSSIDDLLSLGPRRRSRLEGNRQILEKIGVTSLVKPWEVLLRPRSPRDEIRSDIAQTLPERAPLSRGLAFDRNRS
jgi:hypothetical protein